MLVRFVVLYFKSNHPDAMFKGFANKRRIFLAMQLLDPVCLVRVFQAQLSHFLMSFC